MAGVDLKQFRHPSETSRFLFALIVVVPLSLLALIYLVITLGLILIPILLGLVFIRNIVLANFLGNFVRVSEHNFPQIARWSDEVRAEIGYSKPIDVFVYEEGSFNAALVPILKKKAVLLNSETVHNSGETELKWILGRFVGYLKGKKMRFWLFEVFLNSFENLLLFNFFLYPYERAAVLTGDRIGAYAAGFNQPRVLAAMTKLMVGPDVVGHVTPQGIAEQDAMLRRKPFFSLMARLFSPFPHMTRRYTEMLLFFREAGQDVPEVAAIAQSARPAIAPTDRAHTWPSSVADPAASPIEGLERQARGPGLALILLGTLLGLAVYGGTPILLGRSGGLLLEPVLVWTPVLEARRIFEDGNWPYFLEFWGMIAGGAFIAALVSRQSGGVNAYAAILFIYSLGFAFYTWMDWGFDPEELIELLQYLGLGVIFLLTACIPGYAVSRVFGKR
ncbi:MAG: M48 family metallopeptidase [Henriciella sp.]